MGSARLSYVSTPDVDDGEGRTEMYRIEDFKKVPVSDDMFGQFFAGDSYIIKYTYEQRGKEYVLLYFWLGKDSTADEKGSAALIAKEMDDELGGAPTQVRVTMGKEPSHFLKLFGGKMVVHSGGKASGFKSLSDSDSYDEDGTKLFHVRGVSAASTRAVQVREEASALNSGDCFLLLSPLGCYLWIGDSASQEETDTARAVAPLVMPTKVEEVNEGFEPSEFWQALGGKAKYASSKELPEMQREPQLFQCSNASGSFNVEPVFDFCQADLDEDDVFLLDCFTVIFLWIGSNANEQEKQFASETAEAYKENCGYSADTTVLIVKSGNEPSLFTCNFVAWDPTAARTFVDPYEIKLAKAMEANAANEPVASPARNFVDPLAAKEAARQEAAPGAEVDTTPAPAPAVPGIRPGDKSFSYEELKGNGLKDIDQTKKESYLSDKDFATIFNMSKKEFGELKLWKQLDLKKKVGLF